MKKLSTILLAGIMCVSFAACGTGATIDAPTADGTTPDSVASPAADSSTDAPAASGEIPTLVWWVQGTEPEDLAAGCEEFSKYTAEKIGAKIEIKISGWGDWDSKVNTIVNSGEYFDIMFTNNSKYNSFVNLGAFADITEMVQNESPDLWNFVPQNVWDGTKIGGKIYAVPTYKDSSITQYWVFDDQYAKKYGIDVSGGIKTMQDLDKPFREMKAGEGASFYPLQLLQSDGFNGMFESNYDQLTVGLQPMGVRIDDSSRKVVCALEQEDIMAELKLLHKWYVDGIINPDAPTLTEPNKMLPFMSAQGFPGAEAQWQVLTGVEKYVMFPVAGPTFTTDSIQGSMNAIYSGSKYKSEALQFIQLANTDHKLRDMLAFGIEGKHFEYVSENVVHKLTDTWTLPAYQQATFFTMSTMDDAPADQWEQVKKLNEQASPSVCLGFAMDISDVTDEVANCKAVWDKYKYEMRTGASDPEVAVPACIAELKANGFDTIMSEAQKQIDAYFA